MHTLLSVAAALALAAEAPPAQPPSDEGPTIVKTAPSDAAGSGAPAEGAPAAAAAAEPPPPPATPKLAVVPLDGPTELALLGRSLSEAIAQEAAKLPGVEVLPPSAVLSALGPNRAAMVAHCGEAVACYAAPAEQLGAAQVVGGWIDRVGSSYRFGLVLVDAKNRRALARVQRDVPIASRRIRADVLAAAGPLLRGEAAATGTLAILTEDPGADVKIDDRPAGKTPLETKLPTGKHKVEVSQRGKVRVEPFWVEVPANGLAEQRVRLYDIPVAERKPGEIETVVDMGKEKKRRK